MIYSQLIVVKKILYRSHPEFHFFILWSCFYRSIYWKILYDLCYFFIGSNEMLFPYNLANKNVYSSSCSYQIQRCKVKYNHLSFPDQLEPYELLVWIINMFAFLVESNKFSFLFESEHLIPWFFKCIIVTVKSIFFLTHNRMI